MGKLKTEVVKPEDKAKALIDKFFVIKLYNKHANIIEEIEHAKACALICVDEILNQQYMVGSSLNNAAEIKQFWLDVKEQIKKYKQCKTIKQC